MLLDTMKFLQTRNLTSLGVYDALLQEYRNVFERVSFQFDAPAAQMAADLGLQR